MNTTKRQHYVWRNYLRAWATEEIIPTYFKQLNKIDKVNLMGVAQERYFYKLNDFSEEQEIFLKAFINQAGPPSLRSLNLNYLELFTAPYKFKKLMNEAEDPNAVRAEEMQELEINLMEKAHGAIENLGSKLIAVRAIEELERVIEDDDYLFDALIFLCSQFFRTKNMHKKVTRSFTGTPYEGLAQKSWNVLSFICSTIVARNVAVKPGIKFTLYQNNTEVHFITGDQPVFNLLSDLISDDGKVIDLEFYYPLSPSHALSIHFREDQVEKYANINIAKDQVQYLNSKVISNSDYFVFADSQDQLNQLKLLNEF